MVAIIFVSQKDTFSQAHRYETGSAEEGSVLDTTQNYTGDLFANDDQINQAKQRLANGDEPTKTSYKFLSQRAQTALSDTKTYSVQSNGGGDKLSGSSDMNAARTAANYARDLALVYRLTGDRAYADKALKIIRYTFFDTQTKMAPTFATNSGTQLLYMGRVAPTMFFAVDLLKDYNGWQSGEIAKIQSWAKELGYFVMESMCTQRRGEGSGGYRRVLIMSSAGAFAGDNNLLDVAFSKAEPQKCNDTAQTSSPHKDGFKRIVDTRLSPQGWVLSGIERHKYNQETFYYSVENLDILLHIAEIGRLNNEDLYGYVSRDGRSIRNTLDHHIPYVLGKTKWPYYHTMNHWGMTSVPNSYMLGYLVFQQSAYNQVEEAYQKNLGGYQNGTALAKGFIDGIGDARLLHSYRVSSTTPSQPQPTSASTPKPTAVTTSKPTTTPTSQPVNNSGSWIEAESYSATTTGRNKGVTVSGNYIRSFDIGDWVSYSNVDFGTGRNELEIVMSIRPGNSEFQVRLGSPTGKLIGTAIASGTSDNNTNLVPKTFKYALTKTTGKQSVYFVAINRYGVADIDKFKLNAR